jgi:hypothetical protein
MGIIVLNKAIDYQRKMNFKAYLILNKKHFRND